MSVRPIHLLFLLALPLLASCAGAGGRTDPGLPRRGFVEGADGVRLFYRVAGAGADTVVVLHGGPGVGHEALAPDLGPLEARHTVVYYDQRGGGRSGLPDTTLLGLDRFVEDLEAVRRHFGMEQMTLLAHAFGPLLAASYARAYPGRVERMVFVGAMGPRRGDGRNFAQAQPRDPARERRWQGIVRAFIAGTPEEVVAACRDYEAMNRTGPGAAGRRTPRGTSCSAPAEAVLYGYRYTSQITPRRLGEWDFTDALAAVPAPLLVIAGEMDETPRDAHRSWAASAPDGRLLVIPGAGHGPHVERPEIFFPAVDAFLAGGWPAGAADPTP